MAIVHELIRHMIDSYHKYSRGSVADKMIVIEYLLGLVHTCLLALSKAAIPKIEFKDMIFTLIDQHIRNYGVDSDAINMISAASACYKKDFR